MLLNYGVGEDSRVPLTSRRSNQSILKEISPEYTLEGLMLKLQLQYWPPDAKNWLTGRDPDAGKDGRQEEKGTTEDEMVRLYHWFDEHEFEQALGVHHGQEAWHATIHGVARSQTQLSDWIELSIFLAPSFQELRFQLPWGRTAVWSLTLATTHSLDQNYFPGPETISIRPFLTLGSYQTLVNCSSVSTLLYMFLSAPHNNYGKCI